MGALAQLSNHHAPIETSPDEPVETTGERVVRTMQRQTRLTPTQIESLAKDRALGYTINQLASLYHIHRTTVMSHLKRMGGQRLSS